MILQSLTGETEIELRKLCQAKSIPLKRVPQVKLDSLTSQENHQGVVAYISPIRYKKLIDFLPHILKQKPDPVFLLLDGVEDVRNMGAVARSALAFDVDALITFTRGNAPINDVAVKTSAGALLKLTVCKEDNLSNCLNLLAENSVRILVSSLKATQGLSTLDTSGPIAFVLGSEHRGVSLSTEDYADELFKIEQSEQMDSLNVSVAAGIVLHTIYSKRKI